MANKNDKRICRQYAIVVSIPNAWYDKHLSKEVRLDEQLEPLVRLRDNCIDLASLITRISTYNAFVDVDYADPIDVLYTEGFTIDTKED
jgi:hypothetical protein